MNFPWAVVGYVAMMLFGVVVFIRVGALRSDLTTWVAELDQSAGYLKGAIDDLHRRTAELHEARTHLDGLVHVHREEAERFRGETVSELRRLDASIEGVKERLAQVDKLARKAGRLVKRRRPQR